MGKKTLKNTCLFRSGHKNVNKKKILKILIYYDVREAQKY